MMKGYKDESNNIKKKYLLAICLKDLRNNTFGCISLIGYVGS